MVLNRLAHKLQIFMSPCCISKLWMPENLQKLYISQKRRQLPVENKLFPFLNACGGIRCMNKHKLSTFKTASNTKFHLFIYFSIVNWPRASNADFHYLRRDRISFVFFDKLPKFQDFTPCLKELAEFNNWKTEQSLM